MPALSAFHPPAFVQDLGAGTPQQAQLDALWSTRVEAFTQQAILGNPWNVQYASYQTAYYDPLKTDIPPSAATALVQWNAFPNRLSQYLGAGATPRNPYDLTPQQLLAVADSGRGLQPIPTQLCPEPQWHGDRHPFGPYGPRGWMDEYCEWSVCRDAAGKIVRVDLVCENPEYWHTLWSVSPAQVAELYEQALNAGAPPGRQVSVSVADLQLTDPATGKPFLDPLTGEPAYNPLNRWNHGPAAVRTGAPSDTGGAMHLTSTPNTVQTEMGLAGGASVQRQAGNADPQALICCAQYGQNYRNSDPHIGQAVNQLVASGAIVALADPSGLYIQTPRFDAWQLPDDPHLPSDAQPSDLWQVVRGEPSPVDPVTGRPFPGDMILHAAVQIPLAWSQAGVSFGLEDVTIRGIAIAYGGQIAQTFAIGLFPRPLPQAAPPAVPCVAPLAPGTVQPLQLMTAAVWDAYYDTTFPTPAGPQMSLASNTVIVPASIPQGASDVELALTCSGAAGAAPQIAFGGEGVAVSGVSAPVSVSYAVPGNSYPGDCQLVRFTISVDASAAPGLRGLTIANAGQRPGPAGPGLLNVVAA